MMRHIDADVILPAPLELPPSVFGGLVFPVRPESWRPSVVGAELHDTAS